MNEHIDPEELDAALRMDRAADEALAGKASSAIDAPTQSLLKLLAQAQRADPPASLATRVGATVQRAQRWLWLPAQIAAAGLGLAFAVQGIGNLTSGPWVAHHLHTVFDAHAFFEGGIVLLAIACVLLVAGFARRFLDLAVATGVPVGLAFAIHGLPELGEFPAGGALHLTQGMAALVLAVLWWRARRYVLPGSAKRGHEH